MERGKDFAELVHIILTMDEPQPLDSVAAALGLKYDAFYSRLCGRVLFSPEEIQALFGHVKDERLVEYFLKGTEHFLAERSDADKPAERIERQVARMILASSDVLRAVEDGLKDNRLDHRDKERIKQEVIDAERALASLHLLLATE